MRSFLGYCALALSVVFGCGCGGTDATSPTGAGGAGGAATSTSASGGGGADGQYLDFHACQVFGPWCGDESVLLSEGVWQATALILEF